MTEHTPEPASIHEGVQFLIGLAVGIVTMAFVAALAVLHVPLVLPFWISVFVAIWVLTFITIRKHWYLVIVGFGVGGLATYVAASFLFGVWPF